MTEPEPEPLEGELLCDRNDQCVLLYQHEGVCRFKGNIPNRFAGEAMRSPLADAIGNLNLRNAGPSPAQRLIGNIFAAAMNAGVQDATITSDVRGVRLHGHMAEPDDQPKEIDG